MAVMEINKENCKEYEFFETPKWAVRKILEKELLTETVIDPCVGSGAIIDEVEAEYVIGFDIVDWGLHWRLQVKDFLTVTKEDIGPHKGKITVFVNPPFSQAVEFVKKSFELGAYKIICFQRFAWWESQKREEFWREFPPNRIYVCADRADCWRADIPMEERGSGTPTAHAWFVWEEGHPPGTLIGHIRKC